MKKLFSVTGDGVGLVYSAKQFAQEGKNSLRNPVVCEQTVYFNLIKTVYAFI